MTIERLVLDRSRHARLNARDDDADQVCMKLRCPACGEITATQGAYAVISCSGCGVSVRAPKAASTSPEAYLRVYNARVAAEKAAQAATRRQQATQAAERRREWRGQQRREAELLAEQQRREAELLAAVERLRVEAEQAAQRELQERRLAAARPEPRLIRRPRDAEEVAAEWMRFLGFTRPMCTPPGADGGIDVLSEEAAAQVKMEGLPVGQPVVMQILGAAVAKQRRALFFALSGYTDQAVRWSEAAGVALFEYDFQGEPTPANVVARTLMQEAEHRHREAFGERVGPDQQT